MNKTYNKGIIPDERSLMSEFGDIFDISAYNLTEGQPTQYADLAVALGTNGANVPVGVRAGGMQVRFINSSTGQYKQCRLMAASWSTTVTDWQDVDETPTAGSRNLVESGGVFDFIEDVHQQLNGSVYDNAYYEKVVDFKDKGKYLYYSNNVYSTQNDGNYNISDYLPLKNATKITIDNAYSSTGVIKAYIFYNSSKQGIGTNIAPETSGEIDFIINSADFPEGAAYIRCTQIKSSNSSIKIEYSSGLNLSGRIDSCENSVNDLEVEINGETSTTTVTEFTDTGKFLYASSTLDSTSYNITTYLDIENAIEVKLTNVRASTGDMKSYVIYDSSYNILATNPTPAETGDYNYDLTPSSGIPAGAKYIRCTQHYQSNSSVAIIKVLEEGLKYSVLAIREDITSLNSRVDALEEGGDSVSITTPLNQNVIKDFTTFPATHFNTSTGAETSSQAFTASDFIEVEASMQYTAGKLDKDYGGYKSVTIQEACFYNSSKVFIANSAATSVSQFTAPATAKYVRISVLSTSSSIGSAGVDNINELTLVKGSMLISVYGKPYLTLDVALNPLCGKKWLLIGDSNTEHNARANGKYDEFIQAYTGVVPQNIGKSGGGFRVYNNTNYVFINILNDFAEDNPTYSPDFITIMGGSNDVTTDWSNIGTYTDETNATVFGNMYLLTERIKSLYPNVPFMIITPFPHEYGDATQNEHLGTFVEEQLKFCLLRNIPCLDLYSCSGIRPDEPAFNAKYFSSAASPTGDGAHLNYWGQKLISPRIREFIMSHVGEF